MKIERERGKERGREGGSNLNGGMMFRLWSAV